VFFTGQQRMSRRVAVGVGEAHMDLPYAAPPRVFRRTAVQPHQRRTCFVVINLDLRPAHRLANPRAERLGNRLFRRKPGGIVRNRIRKHRAISRLVRRQNAL